MGWASFHQPFRASDSRTRSSCTSEWRTHASRLPSMSTPCRSSLPALRPDRLDHRIRTGGLADVLSASVVLTSSLA